MSAPLARPLVSRIATTAWLILPWCAFALYWIASRPDDARAWPAVLATGLVLAVTVLTVLAPVSRRWPLISLALLLAGFTAVTLTLGSPPAALLQLATADLAVFFIAAACSRLTSALAIVLTLAAAAVCWVAGRPIRFPSSASAELAAGLTVAVAWLIGRSVGQSRMHAEVARSQAVAAAVIAERLRIAREVHDMVAHSIGVIAIQAGMGSRVIDTQPAEARNALTAIEGVSRETLAGLRRVLGTLRDPPPSREPEAGGPGQPAAPAPGLTQLEHLAATARQAGLEVDLAWQGEPSALPADIELSAFRIVQEAVTNVLRHADAQRCQICLAARPGELSIEVTDDGHGGEGRGQGYGIAGMHERAALLHGELVAGPLPGGGFRVAARLPLPALIS